MPKYKSLQETYLNGDTLFNFGGLVPPILFPDPTRTPTPSPTCPITTQYLEVELYDNTKFRLKLWNDAGFTSAANALCDYQISGTAYGSLGTTYTGVETILSGQHQHQFNLSGVLLPGEVVVAFDVYSYTASTCVCPVNLILPAQPTPTPTPTPSYTPTNTPTNTGTPTPTPTPTDTRACMTYDLFVSFFGTTSNYTWTNCDGTASATTLNPNQSVRICAKENSVVRTSGNGTITLIGTCPLPTPTPTPTPSTTPNAVCPQSLTITSSSSAAMDTGTYTRATISSGITFDYIYMVETGTLTGYFVLGTAPDGQNYPVFELTPGLDANTNLIYRKFSTTGTDLGWFGTEQGTNPLNSGFNGSGAQLGLGFAFVNIGGVRFIKSGTNTGSGASIYVVYPSSCPTPTPTSTLTSTPTPSPTMCVINPTGAPNLLAWYDLQDPTTITTSGVNLLSVNDKSGNGYDLINPLGSVEYKPSITMNFNTKMCATFSGASSMNAVLPNLTIPAGATMFAVFGKLSTASTLVQISSGGTINNALYDQYSLINTGTDMRVISNGRISTLSCSIQVGDSVIASVSADSNLIQNKEIDLPGIICNTISATNTGSTSSTFTDLRVGTTGADAVELLELIVYEDKLSFDLYNCVLNYVKNKYDYNTWI